jgi:hypothetical protein
MLKGLWDTLMYILPYVWGGLLVVIITCMGLSMSVLAIQLLLRVAGVM